MPEPAVTRPADSARTRRIRTAGSRWRILVHRRGESPHSWDISSDHHAPSRSEHLTSTVLDGAEFDELVAGRWLHIEQMDTGVWWLEVGGVTINIKADRDGRPKRIDVYGPGDHADAVEGCSYDLTWTTAADGSP